MILERSALADEERSRWIARAEAGANQGHRVLALAAAEGEREDCLRLLGLVLFWDPPRPEVPDAIDQAQRAGIRVLMITGDHPATALAVAKTIGMAQTLS